MRVERNRKDMNKKIGILTFHSVTNYGAVLQCYALQRNLQSHGFETEVVNYKPLKQEDSLYNFFRFRKFKNLSEYKLMRRREKSLCEFREKNLALSHKKLRTLAEVQQHVKDFDILISGSDQVLNPSTLLYGEAYGGKGATCPTYFLGFPFSGKKIGYALSFGVTQYPEPQLSIAKKYIHYFDKLSVREKTGVHIVETMGRNDAIVVPDPTFLHDPSFYQVLADYNYKPHKKPYIFCFFLRDIRFYQQKLSKTSTETSQLWNNDDGEYSLEGWLNKIRHAEFVITDSFHCMVMCLMLHTPFAVITKRPGKVGMNDRFYTVLEPLKLDERIIFTENIHQIQTLVENYNISWEEIDAQLQNFKKIGEGYLLDM